MNYLLSGMITSMVTLVFIIVSATGVYTGSFAVAGIVVFWIASLVFAILFGYEKYKEDLKRRAIEEYNQNN